MRTIYRIWRSALTLAVNNLANILPDDPISTRLRPQLWRLLGNRIGPKVTANGGGFCNGRGLSIGKNTFINRGVYFDLSAPVTIGANISVGNHVRFVTTGHEIGSMHKRCGAAKPAPIKVRDGAWIGACATILPGVTIGKGAVVAAGALVNRDVPANVLVAGVPARIVRNLDAAVVEIPNKASVVA